MLGNIYKHKASGACFSVKHRANMCSMENGTHIIDLFDCMLVKSPAPSERVRFLLSKEWFISAEHLDFEKIHNFSKITEDVSNVLKAAHESNTKLTTEQWLLFGDITYAGMFSPKSKLEVSAQEVYEHFNPHHPKNESSTNT